MNMKQTLLLGALIAALAMKANAAAILAVDINSSSSSTTAASFTDPYGSTINFTGKNVTGVSDTTWSFTGLSTTYTQSGTITVTFAAQNGTALNFNQVIDRSNTGSTTVNNTNIANIGGSGKTYYDLYKDVILGAAGVTRITISGLKASSVYEFYFQSVDPAAFGRGSNLLAVTPGVTNPAVQTGSGGGAIVSPATSFSNFDANSLTGPSNISFVASSNTALTSSTSGQIILDWTAVNTNGRLNGFQIFAAPIPEPSAFAALAGFAAIGFAVGRRRRKA